MGGNSSRKGPVLSPFHPKGVSVSFFGRRQPLWVSAPALVAVLLLLWAFWPTTILEIRAGADGRLLKTFPVTPGDKIIYRYVHSVAKTPVDEIMEVAPNDHLVLRETVYQDFGAGLPGDSHEIDGTFSIDFADGRFRISGMSRDIPTWEVRVAFTAQQTLLVKGQTMRLDSLAPPTSLLVINVTTRPRVESLLG